MKKNLAKRVVLGLLTGAVLMSSSVVWAADNPAVIPGAGENSIVVSTEGHANQVNSIAIGYKAGVGQFSNVQNNPTPIQKTGVNGVAIGAEAEVIADGGVALGAQAKANGENSVALGYGSIASGENVVSVGNGGATDGVGTAYRKIVNVEYGSISDGSHEAVTGGQLKEYQDKIGTGVVEGDNDTIDCIDDGPTLTDTVRNLASYTDTNIGTLYARTGTVGFSGTNYLDGMNLTQAAQELDAVVAGKADASNVYSKTVAADMFLSKTDAANTYVQKVTDNNKTTTSIGDFVVTETSSGSTVTINENDDDKVVFDGDGITVGEHSARMSGKGFYVWAPNDSSNHNTDYAIASMTDDGKIKGANGNFEVGADGSVKAAGDKFKVDKDGNVSAEKITAKEVEAENLYTKAEIDEKLGSSNASVAGINQRLDRTNAKINKVGAGAAALAALHPLDYDPDDKLTFSAGMGNYAGENAAALGAFYRPNEKFMLSLGGTMGNGENMVNLGISIGLDKANGFAKMSKRELIQEVNAVKAENEAIKADNEAMKAEMAEMKAMLQELLAKK